MSRRMRGLVKPFIENHAAVLGGQGFIARPAPGALVEKYLFTLSWPCPGVPPSSGTLWVWRPRPSI